MKGFNVKPLRTLAKSRSTIIKSVSFTAIIFLAFFFILGYIWKVARTSGYFKIKDIVTGEAGIADLSYLKGRNIFSIDLDRESRYILGFLPECKNVMLVRLLPDRLYVEFVKRQPVALLKFYRYFTMDDEGVLFYASNQPELLELPLIVGLETKIFGPTPGRKYKVKELALALQIIKESRRGRALGQFQIKKIDVTNASNASFFMPLPVKIQDSPNAGSQAVLKVLEVKIGESDTRGKVAFLLGFLAQAKNDLANIKYIDLRFKDPVIKFEDAQSK